MLVDIDIYTPDFSNDECLGDIPSAARIALMTTSLTNVTVYGGIVDFDDVLFPAVAGTKVGAVLVYKVGASEAVSWLVCLLDNGAGLPITPTGNDIEIRWSNGVNRVFRV